MNHLTRNDLASALQVLAQIEAQAVDVDNFARAAVRALHAYVASELTAVWDCDLITGHRHVVGLPGARLGADETVCFDRHFFEQPRGRNPGIDAEAQARCLSGLVSWHDDQRTGLAYTLALPLLRDPQRLVSVVLNRRRLGFSERDRERLELLRPHLAFLYGHARQAPAAPADPTPPLVAWPATSLSPLGLTLREDEVMHWLAGGKTDAEIAALLSISPRTVQKHLEHIYVKLGVETRTAAVMRALAAADHGIHVPPTAGGAAHVPSPRPAPGIR